MQFQEVLCWFMCLCFLYDNIFVVECRQPPVYVNQFAVYIPSGPEVADKVAVKYGFKNLGQIGSLKNYYLLEHNHIQKRSTLQSDVHHDALRIDNEVHWFQQQHEKRRKKRDLTFPSYFDYGEGPKLSLPDVSHHDQHYRAFGIPSSFPDPLYKEQWYLNGGSKDGFDMNVVPAWQRGYTGKGVVVSILDDGIQTNHPDLALNYDHLASTDINDNDDDPMPRDNGDNKHGTRCAGEVAGVAYNDYCGIGVAYNASIGGVRMLDGTVNDAVEARALGLNPEHIDIYSASWGPEDDGKTVDGPGPLARRAFIYGVTSGRKGKGSIFVWASGNGGRHTDSCNCDGYTNSIFTLSISSATQGGYKPWYLEECSSTLATTYSSGTPGHDKSVATVDMDAKLRPDRICTVEHTGTSASAPLAAGICALALEANPELTWRDMQYLVVLTSRSGPLEKESGWIVNGVKRKVSHKFGYGLMDAAAMVSLAEKWNTAPPQHICKSQEINEEKEIQSIFGATMTVHMDVDGCGGTYNEVRFLEHVQCKISLRFFPRGNLRITLTSPMGTTSTLLFERPRDVVSSNFDDWPFLSVHFWGERADGRWTLQIVNAGNRHVNQPGLLKKWQLIFYGTATDPIHLRPGAAGRNGNHPAASVAYPTAPSAPLSQGSSVIYGGNPTAAFAGSFHNFQNVYSVSGSDKVEVSAPPAKENSLEVGGGEGSGTDGKHILYECDSQCDSQGCYGKGPSQCVSCKYYKLDGTCVSKCPPRSFPKGQFCWPCHESCETCAGAGQDSCLVCAPAHLRVTDLSVCLQQCPEGYLEDTEKSVCIPCESNCGSCQEKPDHCTSCDHHLVLYNNKCYSACPTYTYETGDYNCAPCHSSCETCNGSSETQCVSCPAGRFALSGTCLNACPEGYYADKKRKECLECPHGCSTCNGAVCLACLTGWTLDNRRGRCMPPGSNQCDSAEYHDGGGGCRPCHSTCESCWGPTEDSCLACPSPLFLHIGRCLSTCPEKGVFPERGTCTPCPHTCISCSSLHNCTQCVEGLHLQSGECRSTCADGYYSDRGVCAKCYLSCSTCSGPRRDQCVACPDDWQLAAGECHPECPEGYFKGEFGCQKCHHYCRTCKGEGPSNCSSCPPYLVLEKGLCIECLAWQFYDNRRKSCRSCHPTCRTCSGPGPVSCKSCALPLRFDRIDNQCVPCCTPGTSPPECCNCDQETGECLNYSSGGKRRTAAGADSGEAGAIIGEQENTSIRFEPFATLTALAIGGCATVVVLFGLIFTILQVHSNCNSCWKQGYEKLPTRSRKDLTEKISLAEDEETLSDQDDDEEQLFTKT